MTNDDRLATLLTDALERDAEEAPEMPLRPRWTVDAAPVNAAGTPRSTAAVAIATGARGPRRQRGVVAAMGLVAGLAFVIGGLVVLQRDGSAPPTADVPTSGTRADAPPVPAPGGMMVLDELPDALAGAEVSGSAGSTPIVDPTSIAGIWVHRWYTATMDRPELEPHLMVASYRADEPLGQLTDGEVHEAVVQGVPAELYDDPFSGGRAVSFHDGATMFVLTGFHLTDDELLRAAEHTVVASGRPGAVVDPAFLPPGLVERASGTQFERHFLPLESLREPSPMIRWDVEDAMVWIQTVTEPADLAPLHRLGYGDVTDTTVRGRPAFLTTISSQPDYVGLTWSEGAVTYLLGSNGVGVDSVLDIAERLRPATAVEWDELLRATDRRESERGGREPAVPASTSASPPDARVGSTDVVEYVAGTSEYVIVAGDSASKIAAAHGMTAEELAALNGWEDGVHHPIFPGDVIRVTRP